MQLFLPKQYLETCLIKQFLKIFEYLYLFINYFIFIIIGENIFIIINNGLYHGWFHKVTKILDGFNVNVNVNLS